LHDALFILVVFQIKKDKTMIASSGQLSARYYWCNMRLLKNKICLFKKILVAIMIFYDLLFVSSVIKPFRNFGKK